MPSPSINWVEDDEALSLIGDLQEQYHDDPIRLISYNAIGYVCSLEAVSSYYGDDPLKLAAVICRSIIQGHPLQDGNKRFGMYLATYFLGLNDISVTADNEDYVRVALDLARGTMNLEDVFQWFCHNTV